MKYKFILFPPGYGKAQSLRFRVQALMLGLKFRVYLKGLSLPLLIVPTFLWQILTRV